MVVWDDFLAAEVGASAALTGLIFVGVSINMARILSLPRLAERALQSLVVLLATLLIASLLLVPGESYAWMGAELLAVGGGAWLLDVWLDVGNYRAHDKKYRGRYVYNVALGQAALLPYIASGLAVLAVGGEGLYVFTLGVAFSFIKAVSDAWVLLVEINR